MKTCETCKHWEPKDKSKSHFLPTFGKCHGINMNYSHTEWSDKEVGDSLICTKDFGCVMHQEGKRHE